LSRAGVRLDGPERIRSDRAVPPEVQRLPPLIDGALLPSLILCGTVGLVLLAARLRALFAPLAGRTMHAALLAATCLLGGALRFAVTPHAPLNLVEFTRGPQLVGPFDPAVAGGTAFLDLIFAVVGGPYRLEPVFPAIAAAGALTLPLLFALAARLTRSLWGAQLATLLLALLPLHERYSASANPVVVMVFAAVAGLACLAAFADRRDPVLLLAGALLVLFATLVHGEARLLLVPAALLVALRVPPREWTRMHVLRPLAVAAALALPVLAALALSRLPPQSTFSLRDPRCWDDMRHFAEDYLVHARYQTPWLARAALAGAAIGLLLGDRAGALVCSAWSLALGAAFLYGGQAENNCVFGNGRYQLGWLPALCILAAMPTARLADVAARMRARSDRARTIAVVPAALALALAAALVAAQLGRTGFDVYRAEWNDQLQYHFLARTLPRLPAGAPLALPPPAIHCCEQQVDGFRTFVLAHRPDLRLLDTPPPGASWPPDRFPDGTIVFLGLPCWLGQEAEPHLGPECDILRQRYSLDALADEQFPNRPYFLYGTDEHFRYQSHPEAVAGTIRIGFYRIGTR
jgi:hypothetical protein